MQCSRWSVTRAGLVASAIPRRGRISLPRGRAPTCKKRPQRGMSLRPPTLEVCSRAKRLGSFWECNIDAEMQRPFLFHRPLVLLLRFADEIERLLWRFFLTSRLELRARDLDERAVNQQWISRISNKPRWRNHKRLQLTPGICPRCSPARSRRLA